MSLELLNLKQAARKFKSKKFDSLVKSFLPKNPDEGDLILATKLAIRSTKESINM